MAFEKRRLFFANRTCKQGKLILDKRYNVFTILIFSIMPLLSKKAQFSLSYFSTDYSPFLFMKNGFPLIFLQLFPVFF